LNLPEYSFTTRNLEKSPEIFDSIRKKYVQLTPEEWVRQNFVRYLIEEKNYPKSLLAIEKEITVNRLKKRCDVVIYTRDLKPIVVVECKSPSVKINQASFDQASKYNLSLNVKYIIITNGMKHYCCTIDEENKTYIFKEEIPSFLQMS
jgi:type I site-specific restriction endonuclease